MPLVLSAALVCPGCSDNNEIFRLTDRRLDKKQRTRVNELSVPHPKLHVSTSIYPPVRVLQVGMVHARSFTQIQRLHKHGHVLLRVPLCPGNQA